MAIHPVLVIVSSCLPFLVFLRYKRFILFEIFALAAITFHGTYLFGAQVLYLLLLTYIISTAAELVSLKTPFSCFGIRYRYALSHKFFSSKINILGVYPLEISFAWVILKYISFALGLLISTAFSLPKVIEVMLIPLVLVSLDFIIDPVCVHTKKLWVWEKGSRYFGIPLRNFLGWYVVGLLASVLFHITGKSSDISFSYFYIPLILVYASFLSDVPTLYKKNKRMSIAGAAPAVIWVVLSAVSLFVLWQRQMGGWGH